MLQSLKITTYIISALFSIVDHIVQLVSHQLFFSLDLKVLQDLSPVKSPTLTVGPPVHPQYKCSSTLFQPLSYGCLYMICLTAFFMSPVMEQSVELEIPSICPSCELHNLKNKCGTNIHSGVWLHLPLQKGSICKYHLSTN